MPVKFLRDVYEGGHVIKQQYEFNHENLVQTQNKQFEIPNDSQDMLSAFFMLERLIKKVCCQIVYLLYPYLWMMKIIF